VQTNGTYNGVYIGNGSANAAVIVNPGSVWSLGTNPTVSNNNLTAYVGINSGGNNNTLVVNNGLLTNAAPITLGYSTGNTGNGLIVTNGGQVFVAAANGSQTTGLYIGNGSGSSGNYLRVEGANVAGTKATLNMNTSRINLGNTGSSGNWARIDQGGIITNVTFYSYGVSNAMAIINGGQLYGYVYCGRAAIGNTLIVTGADMAGNKSSILSSGNVYVGGGGTSTSLGCGTNNLMLVGQDGFVRAATVYIGGAQSDTNSVANGLCVTNGGQFFLSGSAGITLGGAAGCNSNWVSVGGSPGPGTNALMSLGGYNITIGGHIAATNNYMTLSSGGIFTNGTITLGGASSRLYFDGGKLVARANGYPISTNAVATDAQILIKAGGAMIDSGAFTITNKLALLEDPASTNGGLTKLGSGKLVLLGNNSYSGSNVVAAGTLTLTGPFNANLDIQNSATLDGTGTLNVQVEDNIWDTVVVNGTLDISQMNLQIHTAGSLSVRDRIIVDYASGVQLGTSFASVTGLPERSRVIYDSVSKKIILSTFPRGTTILFQ
jgi:autotransporter-associated beta strand protein